MAQDESVSDKNARQESCNLTAAPYQMNIESSATETAAERTKQPAMDVAWVLFACVFRQRM